MDLLAPRYKVVAKWPGGYEIGTILHSDNAGELWNEVAGYCWSNCGIREKDVEKYPALLRKLEWWEDRKPEELPPYIRIKDVIHKVSRWALNMSGDLLPWKSGFTEHNEYPTIIITYNWRRSAQPATEEEYNAYLASKGEQTKNNS